MQVGCPSPPILGCSFKMLKLSNQETCSFAGKGIPKKKCQAQKRKFTNKSLIEIPNMMHDYVLHSLGEVDPTTVASKSFRAALWKVMVAEKNSKMIQALEHNSFCIMGYRSGGILLQGRRRRIMESRTLSVGIRLC